MDRHQPSVVALPGSPEKSQQSRDAQKVLRLLSKRLKPLGFERTKPTFFTRPVQHVLEFVHVHKFTFGPTFRVHFGVRVRSDDFQAAHLNGPSSDDIADPESPGRRLYNFDFGTNEESWLTCAEAMYQCVERHGLDWFASVADPSALLGAESPLNQNAKAALQQELEDASNVHISEATQRALNAA